MFLIVDLAIVLIVAFCIFLGYRKGLIGIGFKIISFIIALVVALSLSYPISNFIINNTEIYTSVETSIENKLIRDSGNNVENVEVQVEGQNNLSNTINNYINKSTTELKNTGLKAVAEVMATTIIRLVVGIALFIITRFILFFFRKLAEVIAELPIIKQFNKSGGIVYGVIKGLLTVYVILAVISLFSPVGLSELINKSFIGSYMYNHNLILMLIL